MNAIYRLLWCWVAPACDPTVKDRNTACIRSATSRPGSWSLALSLCTVTALMAYAGPSTSVEVSPATTSGQLASGAPTARQPLAANPNGTLSSAPQQVNPGALLPTLPNPANETDDLRHRFGDTPARGNADSLGTLPGATGNGFVVPGKKIKRPGVVTGQLGKAPPTAGGGANGSDAVTFSVDEGNLLNVRVEQSAFDTMVKNRNLLSTGNGQVSMSAGVKENLLASAMNTSGTSEARTVEHRNGKIILSAGGPAIKRSSGSVGDSVTLASNNAPPMDKPVPPADTAATTSVLAVPVKNTAVVQPDNTVYKIQGADTAARRNVLPSNRVSKRDPVVKGRAVKAGPGHHQSGHRNNAKARKNRAAAAQLPRHHVTASQAQKQKQKQKQQQLKRNRQLAQQSHHKVLKTATHIKKRAHVNAKPVRKIKHSSASKRAVQRRKTLRCATVHRCQKPHTRPLKPASTPVRR